MLVIVIVLFVMLVLLLPPLALQLSLRLLAPPPRRSRALSAVRDEHGYDWKVADPHARTVHHVGVEQPSARLIG